MAFGCRTIAILLQSVLAVQRGSSVVECRTPSRGPRLIPLKLLLLQSLDIYVLSVTLQVGFGRPLI